MKPLSQYAPACAALSRDAFVQRYPGPFLVHSSRGAGALQTSGGGRTLDGVVVDDPSPDDAKADVQSVFTVSQFAPKMPRLAIGSDPTSALRVPVASVSRVHAWLYRVGDAWRIEDAGSSLGTWVNGEGVEAGAGQTLQPGDRVSLGVVDLTFLPAGAFYELVKQLTT
jgi:pSer/pThr/pTyr-binding forkhead associated (FHA) protein